MGKKIINENTTVVDLRKKATIPHIKHTDISDASSHENPLNDNVTAQPIKKALSTRRKKIFLIIGVVVLLIGMVSLWKYQQLKANRKNLDCSKSTCIKILNDAYSAFGSQNVPAQKKIVDQIRAIKHYDEQPNYDYVITQYYINISDGPNAQIYLNKLVAVYGKSNYSYNDIIKPIAREPDSLKSDIEFLHNQANEAQSFDKVIYKRWCTLTAGRVHISTLLLYVWLF